MPVPKKAYYAVNQVLFHFEAPDGKPVFPMAGGNDKEPVPEKVLLALEKDFHIKLPVTGQRALRLADGKGSAFAFVRLELANGHGSIAQLVMPMTEKINAAHGRFLVPTIDGRILWLIGVTPNWLCGATQGTSIGVGGPAGKPKWVTSLNRGIGAAGFADVVKDLTPNEGQPVAVFILDTLPGTKNIPRKLNLGFDLTSIYSDRSLEIVDDGGHPIVHGDPLESDVFMVEHGPFIAGIVHSIASHVDIYLIQVLNEHGVGSVESMTEGFEIVKRYRERPEFANTVCIVNCSFVIAAPTGTEPTPDPDRKPLKKHETEDLDLNRPDTLPANERLFQSITDLARLPDTLHDDALCRIVAAAGNDSEGTHPPYMARYPARLPTVLGVGALDYAPDSRKWVRASYSNGPDWEIPDGLMTLGRWRGAFSGTIPVDPGNLSVLPPTGIAEWAGTSFAAPVITGLFAMLIGEYGLSISQAQIQLDDAVSGSEIETGGKELV